MEELKKAKCCCCEQPMSKSKHINAVMLDKIATWDYPVAGNVLDDTEINEACAVVCDTCIQGYEEPNQNHAAGDFIDSIKFAIESRGNEFVYHDINTLEKIKR
jgi:hypothetical protein